MTCENCIALSALRSEFSEVKSDVKLIIRLISMLLVDRSTEIGEVAQSVQNIEPDTNPNQPNSGSSVASEANVYGEQQQEASAPELGYSFEPIDTSHYASEAGVDAAAMINVKVEENSELETPSETYENSLARLLSKRYHSITAFADVATTSADASDIAEPWRSIGVDGGRPKKRLRRTDLEGEVICVGEDPNVLLPAGQYMDIVNHSNSAPALLRRLVTATIPDYANYTFEIVKDLAACPGARSRDGLKSLREHPAFEACVSETAKQFGPFEFDSKLQGSLYNLCYTSRTRKTHKAYNANAYADDGTGASENALGALFQPSTSDHSASKIDVLNRMC